jgi:hypothetical protein
MEKDWRILYRWACECQSAANHMNMRGNQPDMGQSFDLPGSSGDARRPGGFSAGDQRDEASLPLT